MYQLCPCIYCNVLHKPLGNKEFTEVPLTVGQISKPNHPLEMPESLPLMGEDLKTR